jgi:hypothetical protein
MQPSFASLVVLVSVLGAGLVACGGGASAGSPEALMTAGDLRSHPWPSDALLGADGHIAIAPPFPFAGDAAYQALLAESLSELDGFGTTTSVFFPVSAPVEIDDGAAAQVIDLEGGDAPLAFPLFYREATQQLVAMAPAGTVLRERHRYACIVDGGVHGAGGPLRPSAAMTAALRAETAPAGAYALLAGQLASATPPVATAFTTRAVSDWVSAVRRDLETTPPKALSTRTFEPGPDLDALFGGPVTTTRPGLPPAGGVQHGHVALVVEGTYASPNYLSATPGKLGLFDDGPTVKSVDAVPFLLILPKDAAGPVPVAIFQHGINGDRSTMLLVADDYAAHGYATFGIDIPWHGSRAPGAVDKVYNIGGAPGADGIGDPRGFPVANFFDFNGDPSVGVAALDARVMRDNFRQATVELMQAVRLARGGDWSAAAGVSLDGSQLVYTAASFGSLLGANVMAVDPNVQGAVLAAAGGGLFIDLVGNSSTLGSALPSLFADVLDRGLDVSNPDQSPQRAQLSLALLQTVLESGDGLALAGQSPPDKSVLFLEAFNDEVVPNHATESLAAAWRASQLTLADSPPTRVVSLPQVAPPVERTPLRALVQLAPACHSFFTTQTDSRTVEDGGPPFVPRATPLPVDNPIERAHALALDFMDGFRKGMPRVSDGP